MSRRSVRGAGLLLALLGAATSPLRGQQEPPPSRTATGEPPRYDPNLNMAPDGTTVIKPQLPADLPNPDRWRYTPGGRIKPGNPFERFLVSTWITPLFFRSEDVGFGGGLAFTDVDFRNLGWREFANIVASYTEEGQQRFSFHWQHWLHHRAIPEGGIIREERSHIALQTEYSRTLTRRFYGFGSRTRAGDETSYTEEAAILGGHWVHCEPEPGDDLLLGVGAHIEHHGLSRGRVHGVPSTDDVFPNETRTSDGVDQLWLSGSIAYDTRDSIANPYHGWRVGLGVEAVPLQDRFDFGARIALDASVALKMPPLFHDGGDTDEDNPPTDVLAIGGFVVGTVGELPYYSLPRLGGDDTLRGYVQRRFTDRVATHGTVEYRVAVVPRGIRFTDTIRLERISLGLFYDFGTVVRDLGKLDSGRWLDSYGVGLRLGLQREATFRVDLGFSREDTVLTIAFGHSF